MIETPEQEHRRAFDLSELVRWEQTRNSRGALIPALAGTALGILVVGAGVYTFFLHAASASAVGYGAGVALVATGIALAVGSWSYARALARKPNLLEIGNDFLSYGRKENPPLTRLRWDDPRLRLVLQDGTNLRARLGTRDRFAVFSLIPNGTTRIPIPQEAFFAILSEAERHGLSRKRHSTGGIEVTSLTPARAQR